MSPAWRPGPAGRQFDETRRRHRGWPRVLAEGDSWFAHPIQWNILYHLSAMGGYAIRRLAHIGDELGDMVRESPDHEPQYLKQLRRFDRRPFELLLFSGGGNDLLGDPLPDLLRHRSEVPRGWRGLLRRDALDAEIARIRRAYQRVILRTLALRPACQILVHGYDYPFPRRKGATLFWGRVTLTGPWILPVMRDEKGIEDASDREKLAKELIDAFNGMLRDLDRQHAHFHHVDLRGTLPSVRQWDDEIHPKSAGFKKMAKTFRARMAALVPPGQ